MEEAEVQIMWGRGFEPSDEGISGKKKKKKQQQGEGFFLKSRILPTF